MLSIQKKIFLAAVIPVALIYNLLFILLQWQYVRYQHLGLLPMVINFVVIQCLIFLAIWLASDLISRAFISISEAIDRIAIGDSNQQSAASHGTVNDCLSRMTRLTVCWGRWVRGCITLPMTVRGTCNT